MPSGGTNEIDQLSIGIGADLDPLIRGMAQAKTEAAQKGEEAGKAWSQHFVAASSGGGAYGGGVAGPGLPTAPPTSPGPLGGTPAPSGGGIPAYAATTAGASALTAVNTGILAAQAVAGTFDKFEKIGETISGGAKVMLEASQAMERSSAAMARTIQMEREFWEKRTGADKGIDPAQMERVAQREAEAESLRQKIAGTTNIESLLTGALGLIGLRGTTPLGQTEQQLAEVEKEARIERRAVSEIGRRQRLQTTGGTLETVAGELGMDTGRIQPGRSLQPYEAEIYRDMLRDNPQMLQQLVKINTGSWRDQQKAKLEMIRGRSGIR